LKNSLLRITKDENETHWSRRVVHGGPRFKKPTQVTIDSLDEISHLGDLAPLHNPPSLAVIQASLKAVPNAQHIMLFDTMFHDGGQDEDTLMARADKIYALPLDMCRKRSIRRYEGPI
jgi:acetate kinase